VSTEPRATYRVQLRREFPFSAAAGLVEYLDRLGVSHLYSSPILQAAPGSTHGYDVVDHGRVSEDLGGPTGQAELAAALRGRGLGWMMDVVANHMAIVTPWNRWWWDVLENGVSSRYAAYFDVDWDPPEARTRNIVLLPVLEDHYGRVLEAGLLRLFRQEGRFEVRYRDHVWPVAPHSMDGLLAAAAAAARSDDLAFLSEALGRLEFSPADDLPAIRRRHRHKEVLKQMLARLCRERPELAQAVDAEVVRVSGDPDALDALLARQSYRLAHWRMAAQDLGYRRFFDVNSLAGLRVEVERVFVDTHALILGWLADGTVDGLRVDHPDGLRDPAGYLQRMRSAASGAWVVVEKVLAAGERLPSAWPVEGTTGYDFLARVSGVLLDPAGERPLTDLYAAFTGEPTDYPEVLRDKKRQVLRDVLGSDLNRLATLAQAVCEGHRGQRDHTRHDIQEALRETIAWFPVYRTYVGREPAGEEDVHVVQDTVAAVRAGRPDIDPMLLEFLQEVLLGRVTGEREAELVRRFQQVTGPAMAKGAEDTAFYCYNRLLSLNEVGGDPGQFGLSLSAFHEGCQEAHWRWPRSLLATSTHDTKRSEDVRVRIHLLAEIPDRWADAVQRWAHLLARHWTRAPDRNLEYYLYQTLVGAWPIELPRLKAHVEKAAREAKVHTSWNAPQADYEAGLMAFVEGVYGDERFRAELESFLAPLLEPARVLSLSQLLLKLTAPGVPDVYQGEELWQFQLVDPDNRRPVDYERRRRLLAEVHSGPFRGPGLEGLTPEAIWARADEGLPKLWVTARGLAARRSRADAFGPGGAYEPLPASGRAADHVIAFLRNRDVVTVAPRFPLRLGGRWEGTALTLPEGRWRNELTGEEWPPGAVPVSRLLARFPVALLLRTPPA
jgi:(1->4)-alpha-D-glucan 1-alpha-D-glucosylmutase